MNPSKSGTGIPPIVGPREGPEELAGLLPQICDRVVLSATLFLIIFAPLAYGAVDPWAQLLIRIVVLVMFGSWALKTAYLRERVTEPSSPALRRFPFCLSSAGCGYSFLQWKRLLLATYGGASRH